MNHWPPEKLAVLKAMREAGHPFEEISEVTGMSESNCKIQAGIEGIYKGKRAKPIRHIGLTDDGPEMNHRKSGRPMAKKPVMRDCIGCKKEFKSSDRARNQRCPRCVALGEHSTFFN